MTRLAILSDIHGNAFAFEAVVEDIARQQVDEVIVAGDLVGRGPQGSRIVERVQSLGWPSIRGNHEDYLLGFIHRQVPEAWWSQDIWAASRWMAEETRAHAAWMDALPFSAARPGLRVVHGSPRSNSEGIGSWTSDEDLRAFLDAVEEPVLVCAHTHRRLHAELEGGTIVNIGSVGLPFNGDWRAQYAIFDDGAGAWQVEFRQIEYDRPGLLRLYDTSGFLREGLITAELLKKEVEEARPYLVPFLKWARGKDLDPDRDSLDTFLSLYDPTLPLSELIELLS